MPATVLLISTLIACGSENSEKERANAGESPTAQTGDTIKETGDESTKRQRTKTSFLIGVASPNNKVPYFSKLVEGMTDLEGELNVKLDVQDAQDDANTQINQIQTFIAEGCDLIIMMPVQMESLIPRSR